MSEVVMIILLAVLMLFQGVTVVANRKVARDISAANGRMEAQDSKTISSINSIKRDLDKRVDDIINVHNASIDHYDSEIDDIIKRMNQIIADIHRIDHDEKEIRQYYINFRDPAENKSGVLWAKEYPTNEELDS